jgi:hypothetical protein
MVICDVTLKPVAHHKFLGVHINQTLNWSTHVTYAIAKGIAYMLQFKRCSSTSFGMLLSLTCQLYLAVTVPKMLYTVDVWFLPIYSKKMNTTPQGSKGITTKLVWVECIALISTTSVMPTTASDVLEILANVWPIELCIQNLCQQAALQLVTRPPSHHIHSLMKKAAMKLVKRHPSTLHHLCHTYDINSDSTETVTCRTYPPSMHLAFKMHIGNDKDTAIAYHDLITTSNVTHIYTDSSSTGSKVGAVVILYQPDQTPQVPHLSP